MIGKFSKQTGSVFVAVIIILVVAIVAVLGFIFWNNLQNKPSSNKATPSKSVTDNSKKDKVQPQYLNVDDWSIRFTLPTDLAVSDVYYYKTHVGEGPNYYGFTTSRVRSQGGACDNQVTGSLVTLTRSATKDGSGTLINNTAIGGYFYYSGSSVGDILPTPQCLLTDSAVQDRNLLDEMIKSLSAQ